MGCRFSLLCWVVLGCYIALLWCFVAFGWRAWVAVVVGWLFVGFIETVVWAAGCVV